MITRFSISHYAVFALIFSALLSSCGKKQEDKASQPSSTLTFFYLRVNAGGPTIEDRDGEWLTGAKFTTSGTPFRVGGEKETLNLAAAGPPELYEFVQHMDPTFEIPDIPPGRYRLRLHFVDGDLSFHRAMGVRVDNRLFLEELDPGAVAGEANTVAVEDVVFNFEGNSPLKIEFSKGSGVDSFVAGFELTTSSLPITSESSEHLSPEQGATEDLDWLRSTCGDGALAYSDGTTLWVTELSTDMTSEVGKGSGAEFSPSGARLAWIDDQKRLVARNRKGDTPNRIIATGINAEAGAHWLNEDTVVALFEHQGHRHWGAISIAGNPPSAIPELDLLGTSGAKTDIRRRKDGTWIYASGKTWRTSEKTGHTGGAFGASLSPDGLSVTGVMKNHTMARLTAVTEEGRHNSLRWRYPGGFDHLQWSSNAPNFMSCIDQSSKRFAIISADTSRATLIGSPIEDTGLAYADFTVGNGAPSPWPTENTTITSSEEIRNKATSQLNTEASEREWPGWEDHLIFLWESFESENYVTDIQTGKKRETEGKLIGAALANSHFGIDLRGGGFLPDDFSAQLRSQTIEAVQFSFEALIRVAEPGKSSGSVATFTNGKLPPCFALEDLGGELWWTFRCDSLEERKELPSWRLGPLDANRYHHILVTWKAGSMMGYVDGKNVFRTDEIAGNVWCWPEDATFVIGNTNDSNAGWYGQIEGITIGDQFIEANAAETRFQLANARIKERSDPQQLFVSATLLEITPLPKETNESPLDRCLVEFIYGIHDTSEGSLSSEKIRVLHWAILDQKTLPLVKEIGTEVQLTLEPADLHPNLLNESHISVSSSYTDLPQFFSVDEF